MMALNPSIISHDVAAALHAQKLSAPVVFTCCQLSSAPRPAASWLTRVAASHHGSKTYASMSRRCSRTDGFMVVVHWDSHFFIMSFHHVADV